MFKEWSYIIAFISLRWTRCLIPLEIYNKLQVQHEQLMYIDLRTKSYALHEENYLLKDELRCKAFSFSSIRMKAQQMLFFTGLSTVMFEWLLSKLKGSVPVMYSTLSLEDHLLVVLMIFVSVIEQKSWSCRVPSEHKWQVSFLLPLNTRMALI